MVENRYILKLQWLRNSVFMAFFARTRPNSNNP